MELGHVVQRRRELPRPLRGPRPAAAPDASGAPLPDEDTAEPVSAAESQPPAPPDAAPARGVGWTVEVGLAVGVGVGLRGLGRHRLSAVGPRDYLGRSRRRTPVRGPPPSGPSVTTVLGHVPQRRVGRRWFECVWDGRRRAPPPFPSPALPPPLAPVWDRQLRTDGLAASVAREEGEGKEQRRNKKERQRERKKRKRMGV